ncbi:type I restriction/modification system, specificity subunit [Campylobacter lari subsp. concheus]|uniref:restriction endonuclease subunit S n=1 Tax=Campylobacter lari TaxID=201 RepID=UPI00214A5D25|nr:restriction endonuclease subunit S [Campylobacter lari]EMC9372962.1 restriction endonuclease subunit S [Campylobacter lari]MCR2069505.1 restriction endonuclease subunit S [Campylobacter lari subsp. concheus]
MNNWKKCKLGDICSKITDGSHKSPPSQTSGFPMASVKDMEYNQINLNTCRKISKEDYLELVASGCQPEINDILIAKDGSYLKHVFRVRKKEELVLLSSIAIIRPILEQVCPQFLTYVFKNKRFIEEIETNYVTGAVIPRIVLRDFKEIEITLPPLEEQRQIAIILSSIDDKIELLHEQNKTLEKLAQTLFRHYFIENPNPSWQEKPLSEIARFLNGLACQKYPPKNFLDKLPVLKIKELSDGAIGKNSDYASSEIADDYIVNSGNVIFSWSATLMVKIWGGEKSVLNQHLFKVSSDKYPKWFFYYWTKHHLREFITISQAHATTMGHIKRKDLDNAMCKIPKDEYLKKCDLEISPKIQKIENNLNQIRTLENMRDILIPKLLNGEIRSK